MKNFRVLMILVLGVSSFSQGSFAGQTTKWAISLYKGVGQLDTAHLIYSQPLAIQYVVFGPGSAPVPYYSPSGYFSLYTADPRTSQTGVMLVSVNGSDQRLLSVAAKEVSVGIDNTSNTFSKDLDFTKNSTQTFTLTQGSPSIKYTVVVTLLGELP